MNSDTIRLNKIIETSKKEIADMWPARNKNKFYRTLIPIHLGTIKCAKSTLKKIEELGK